MGILLLNSGTDHLLSEESLSSQDHFTGFYDSRFQTIKFASQRPVEQKGVGKLATVSPMMLSLDWSVGLNYISRRAECYPSSLRIMIKKYGLHTSILTPILLKEE